MLVLLAFTIGACRTAGESLNPAFKPKPAPQNKLKIQVDQDGFYRLSAQDLEASGMVVNDFDRENLRLSQGGKIVPTAFNDDSIIFYGLASDDRYLTKRSYILEVGKSGEEISTANFELLNSPAVTSGTQTMHLEENNEYAGEARYDDANDVWFWYKLRQQEKFDIEIELPNIENSPALIRTNSWGFSFDREVDDDHSFEILINNQSIGTVTWDGQIFFTSENIIPAGLLQAGKNIISLDNRPEGASFLDIMLLDWIELSYAVPTQAVDDRITLATEPGLLRLDNFSSEPLVFNISDPFAPEKITNQTYDNHSVTMSINEPMEIAAIGPDGYLTPTIEQLHSSDWKDNNLQADLIIIAPEKFKSAIEPLVKRREEQGLSVALVPVEEIYDEFGYGEPSPESIKNFIKYAYEIWTEPHPRYLFIVGDATIDFQGNLGIIPDNLVPSLVVPVQFSGETVSDSRLTDVNGDMVPDMAVGRWPVRTVQEVENLVERTIAYEEGAASSHIIFAADGSEPQFADIANELTWAANLNKDDVNILKGATTDEITKAWNNGSWLTTYIGHGSISRWGKDGMFELDSVNALNKIVPPIVLQFTCLTGLFSHPTETSLTEALLTNPNGPVLSIAATSLTLSSHQEPFALELLQQLQNPNIVRIGDAFQEAKLSLKIEDSNGLREISDTFALFGDPSTIIVRPMQGQLE